MRINNIKKSLKNSLDYILSNSSKAIKTGILVAATTILPINYANGQLLQKQYTQTGNASDSLKKNEITIQTNNQYIQKESVFDWLKEKGYNGQIDSTKSKTDSIAITTKTSGKKDKKSKNTQTESKKVQTENQNIQTYNANNTSISTDNTDVQPVYTIVKSFHVIKPGQPYKFDWKRNDEYRNIKPTAIPMSNTGEFVAEFYNGYTTTDYDIKLTSADSAAMEKMRTSNHPQMNDEEWLVNGRQNNVEQTKLLDKILNNESKDDPLINITKKEGKRYLRIKQEGPAYSKYFSGIKLHYDGETISENGRNIALPPLEVPLIIFWDDNADITYGNGPTQNKTNNTKIDYTKEDKQHARTRAYVGVGLENIFDKNYDNTANINRPILLPQAKLGLDFGRLNLGVIGGGYGKLDVVQTITNNNAQGNGGTEEKYVYEYNNIIQYGAEAGLDITKNLGMTFNAKKNQINRTASGTVDQLVDDGYGHQGHVKQDLGTKKESYNYNTLGAGIVYHFNDNISTTAEVDFSGKKPAAVSVNFVWTIGDKYK